ncbi:MAG: rhamnulokinase [Lachnospiraceae bacterium]|nr:rhamnulokinase [Lachnospiraceae bacterium]
MSNYYLAVDIGASSGRHILGHLENGKIVLEEVYRFENKLVQKNGHLCWELDRLFDEIVNGIAECKKIGKIPVSMGIDTWGVDFVLLDENDKVLGDTVAYRDSRTEGVDAEVYKVISEDDLYARTGIQKQLFNTIYQLYAIKLSNPEYIKNAKSFLMVPEYFNFLLTGVKKNEYTNATTGQLVNAVTKDWDYELIEKLGYNKEMFGELNLPKTSVGNLSEAIKARVGFDLEVILPATHDTGSAVMAVPANDDDFVYLSSGTWSLMGIERKEADCSPRSKACNFTNEGGYEYRFRYLKNIMGLWMLQSVRRELNSEGDKKYGFPELIAMAKEGDSFSSMLDVNDASFLAPENMQNAIDAYCERTGQAVPQNLSERLACIYHSLAQSYADTIKEIEDIAGRTFKRLHIVGGGCQDMHLNEMTKKYTGKEVYAGPIEGTALGNLMSQMIKAGDFATLEAAREAVAVSFDIKKI